MTLQNFVCNMEIIFFFKNKDNAVLFKGLSVKQNFYFRLEEDNQADLLSLLVLFSVVLKLFSVCFFTPLLT